MTARTTRDLCQTHWEDANPGEYAPIATRYGLCAQCATDEALTYGEVLVTRSAVVPGDPQVDMAVDMVAGLKLTPAQTESLISRLQTSIGVDPTDTASVPKSLLYPVEVERRGSPGEGFTITSPDGTRRIGSDREY